MTSPDLSAFRRFAVYYTPAPGPWADVAAAWLGWDAVAGANVAHPMLDGLPLPLADLTSTPRKYGFHATMKPPLRLADGKTPEEFRQAVAEFAKMRAPVELDGLRATALGRFVALTPVGDTTALNALAGALVQDLDMFRATASAAELERRRSSGLTPKQDEMLLKWGYPYVFDEFRFHMTLSGRLSADDVDAVASVAEGVFGPLVPAPLLLDAVSLAGEAEDGRFRVIERFDLTGA